MTHLLRLRLCIFSFIFLSISASPASRAQQRPDPAAPLQFELSQLPFRLESDLSRAFNAPESMAGGIAVFDYNGDGRPDIFFTNGAELATLKKSSKKFSNRLFRNDGNGVFIDVTEKAGLAGKGYDVGVAAGDYDNDGYPDLFVAGVHGNTLYHNNGDGTFTDVTAQAGLEAWNDPEYGPLWAITAAWVDVNHDGLLDLFVVNYLRWDYTATPICPDFCHPSRYKGSPNQLFLNLGNGKFQDVSKKWGLRNLVGKGMGVGVADYDLDGNPDLFVTNDAEPNYLLHNRGDHFDEVGLESDTALPQNGQLISGMGLDFRDVNNDGYPDIAYVALNDQTFPLLINSRDGSFEDESGPEGITAEALSMSGFGAALIDFDNDGWKDLFVTRGHVSWAIVAPGVHVRQPNAVFRNPGPKGKWKAYADEAGFKEETAAHHRGCAFGDFDGDGRMDAVVTSLDGPAELWMNRSQNHNHWLDVALRGVQSNRDGIGARLRVQSASGTQFNHQTSSVCYASSSLGPVHFGLGSDTQASLVEISWPSGIVQTIRNVKADQVIHITEPPGAPRR